MPRGMGFQPMNRRMGILPMRILELMAWKAMRRDTGLRRRLAVASWKPVPRWEPVPRWGGSPPARDGRRYR